jgi:ankyrin repeat protein
MKPNRAISPVLFLALLFSPLISTAGDAKRQDLMSAVINGDSKAAKKLLKEGVPASFEDLQTGSTPLIQAVASGNGDIVGLLIEHGAKPDYITSHGDTAIHAAAYTAPEKILKLLLKTKPDINLKNGGGATPLMMAALSGNTVAAKALLEAKAKVDSQEPDGKTALLLAAMEAAHANNERKTEVAIQLLKGKADPNHRDNENHSALYYAVKNQNETLVKSLLEYGATISQDGKMDKLIWEATRTNPNANILAALEMASNKLPVKEEN